MFKRLGVGVAAAAVGMLPITAALANVAASEPGEEETPIEEVEVTETETDLDVEVTETETDLEVEVTETETDEEVGPTESASGSLDDDDLEGDDGEHGELVYMVAACAPRGRTLAGTGVNHGTFVSGVARGSEVTVPAVVDGEVDLSEGTTLAVTSTEEAAALCEALAAFEAALQADQEAATATGGKRAHAGKGKPAHAGKSKHDR